MKRLKDTVSINQIVSSLQIFETIPNFLMEKKKTTTNRELMKF